MNTQDISKRGFVPVIGLARDEPSARASQLGCGLAFDRGESETNRDTPYGHRSRCVHHVDCDRTDASAKGTEDCTLPAHSVLHVRKGAGCAQRLGLGHTLLCRNVCADTDQHDQ
jgi:hypothetical protein